jgi:DNA-3-methyladenine glycosylase II
MHQWDGTRFTHIALFSGTPMKISVTQEDAVTSSDITVTLEGSVEITAQTEHDASRHLDSMLGLSVDLQPFYALATSNNLLRPLADQFMGFKPPRFPSLFEALLNSIACQQVSIDVGILLLNRLAATFGVAFDNGGEALYAFPVPDRIAKASIEDIKSFGFSAQKARAIIELSQRMMGDREGLSDLADMATEDAVVQLSTIRGIGRWSAEYVLLRGIGSLSTLPGDDVGAQKNIQQMFHLDTQPRYDEVKQLVEEWQPYTGLVYFHLLLDKLHTKGVI